MKLRPPTRKEMAHEAARIQKAFAAGDAERVLRQRLGAMKNAQKLYAFHLALENENLHTFNREVRAALVALGWDGTRPLTADGYESQAD